MSKQTVLELLRRREGDFLSGEEISRQLGLSRAAVWKAVDALRRDGYTVEARTGLGYRLAAAPDALTEPEIRRFLPATEVVGRKLVCLSEVDSTNTRAKELAMSGEAEGLVVVADCQTAGRGRMGRSFQSPRGKGIYLTALLRPDLPPERLMERFVRGDESRTTEGSGLGLSIARSLTELQGGTFELAVDGDLFKATVTMPQSG